MPIFNLVETPNALWRNYNNPIGTQRVRGTERNNIFTVGNQGLLFHYNGVSWKTYEELHQIFRKYNSIAVNKNIVVAVGKNYINGIEDKAIISVAKM